jgi:hypothetical protein
VSDSEIRDLSRQLASTSDPAIARKLLFTAVRQDRWLIHRGDWNENTHKIGTLRFLAYLGWKEALVLLRSLPLAHTGAHQAEYPTRTSPSVAGQGAYGEIGKEKAAMKERSVLFPQPLGPKTIVTPTLKTNVFPASAGSVVGKPSVSFAEEIMRAL